MSKDEKTIPVIIARVYNQVLVQNMLENPTRQASASVHCYRQDLPPTSNKHQPPRRSLLYLPGATYDFDLTRETRGRDRVDYVGDLRLAGAALFSVW